MVSAFHPNKTVMDILENYMHFAIVHDCKHNHSLPCHTISTGTEAGDMHEALSPAYIGPRAKQNTHPTLLAKLKWYGMVLHSHPPGLNRKFD